MILTAATSPSDVIRGDSSDVTTSHGFWRRPVPCMARRTAARAGRPRAGPGGRVRDSRPRLKERVRTVLERSAALISAACSGRKSVKECRMRRRPAARVSLVTRRRRISCDRPGTALHGCGRVDKLSTPCAVNNTRGTVSAEVLSNVSSPEASPARRDSRTATRRWISPRIRDFIAAVAEQGAARRRCDVTES